MNLNRSLAFGVSLIWLPMLALAAGEGKKVYRWVDANGVVQYGDKIPPEAARRQSEALDRSGRVRATRPRELTPQEAVVAAEKNRLSQDVAERQAKKAAYDRALIMTYSSVADLQAVRDERLNNVDQRLQLAEKAVTDSEAALAEGRAILASGKKVQPIEQKRIDAAEQALLDALKLRGSLVAEREQITKQFAEDIEQFKSMKAARAG